MSKKDKLTYKDAGVNIDAMAEGLGRVEQDVRSTFTDSVIANIGGFGTLFKPDLAGMEEPVLISSVDGVGTKLMIARMLHDYTTVGEDIVNHCVNDILVQGAKPLYFLDYIGAGLITPAILQAVIGGMAKACRENGMALIGGETAEMPGIYSKEDLDLVGCIVGIADRRKILTGAEIEAGDIVLGLPSSGLHTNGFSLARKLFFDVKGFDVHTEVEELGGTVGRELLKIHRSYFNPLYPLIQEGLIRGLAHLTGGGFWDNIPRILPANVCASITLGSWPVLPVFEYIQKEGDVAPREMFRTFNMGIGMTVVVRADRVDTVKSRLEEGGETVYTIGRIEKGHKEVRIDGIG